MDIKQSVAAMTRFIGMPTEDLLHERAVLDAVLKSRGKESAQEPAKQRTCKNCGKTGHIAKTCRVPPTDQAA